MSVVCFYKVGYFSKVLSKGPSSTTWIWNLHADSYNFLNQGVIVVDVSRKVFSVNLAYLSIVFLWLVGMHFHVVYYSNYILWLKDPIHVVLSF